jgi:hypothetical protein
LAGSVTRRSAIHYACIRRISHSSSFHSLSVVYPYLHLSTERFQIKDRFAFHCSSMSDP